MRARRIYLVQIRGQEAQIAAFNFGLLHLGERGEEVLHGDGAEGAVLRRQLVHAAHGGVAAQLAQVRPGESLRQLRQPPRVNARGDVVQPAHQ